PAPVKPAPSPSQAARPLSALVRGAGPTGALAALALADAGWRVNLVDPSTPTQLLGRSRAYAFTHSSRRLLQRLGLWDQVAPVLQPFDRLDLEDLGARQGSRFTPSDLGRAPSAPQAVGWIGEHGRLMGVLLQQLESRPEIHLLLGPLATGPTTSAAEQQADWIIAADGALSPSRDQVGIGVWHHLYQQQCVTAQVRLRGASSTTAWERLRPEGPFALLPMGGERYQVVWSAPVWRCRQLESLSPAAFLDALAPVLPPGVDVEQLEDTQRAFPVGLLLARHLHRNRTLLLGETAHRCHPVGGQGLNLCWRDVATLHRLAQKAQGGRLPVPRLGSSYARRRWAEVCLTLLITDSLVRLFSNRHPLLVPLRRVVLQRVEQIPLLRRGLLAVMSDGPCQAFSPAAT
ncbi:MAG: FAD-dependent monooxygenase, partial [Cyanobium sp.]